MWRFGNNFRVILIFLSSPFFSFSFLFILSFVSKYVICVAMWHSSRWGCVNLQFHFNALQWKQKISVSYGAGLFIGINVLNSKKWVEFTLEQQTNVNFTAEPLLKKRRILFPLGKQRGKKTKRLFVWIDDLGMHSSRPLSSFLH